MSRTMEKIIPVKITADEVNCYATIMRSCISGTTACLRVGDHEHVEKFQAMRIWAENMYDRCIEKYKKEQRSR